MHKPSVIERAYELAKTGDYKTATEIRMALRKEGFAGIEGHFAGRGFLMSLKALMKTARLSRHAEDSPPA